jgi:hypothetical protein
MKQRSLGNTVKDLFLALLNATLILILLCLFAAWQLANTVESISANFANGLISISPLSGEIEAMTEELAAVRSDLGSLGDMSEDFRSESMAHIEVRLENMSDKIGGFANRVDQLVTNPDILIDYAVESAADEVKEGVAELRGCTLPENT